MTTLVVDGYGVQLRVQRGRLVVEDGMGVQRRTREIARMERDIRHIVILADTGNISLEAVRWCADLGISIVQLDRDGRLLTTCTPPGSDDARIRRAQAAAANSDVGTDIGRALIEAKLPGQASVLSSLGSTAENEVHRLADLVAQAHELPPVTNLESAAANVYYAAWSGLVTCKFTDNDAHRFPSQWSMFSARNSPLHPSKTNRSAADPVNALLNYGYALAEAEARLAAIKVGLDPGIGIIHTDIKARDSLALDLLEPLRPVVDQHVLDLLAVRYLTYEDLTETRTGQCRLLPPLTELMCALVPALARAVGPIAERVAHAVARSHPGKIELRTPLSRANNRKSQAPGARAAARRTQGAPAAKPTCRVCGAQLYDAGRQLCSACWPVHRAALAHRRAQAAQHTLAAARATGTDPTQTAEAKTRRRQSMTRARNAQTQWRSTGSQPSVSEQQLHEFVLPALRDVPLGRIQEATGLSNASASRLRSQKLTPHPRHWDALAGVAEHFGGRRFD